MFPFQFSAEIITRSQVLPDFSLPEDEERNLSAGLDNVIELMVEAESEGEEGEDEGIGEETGVYYSDKSDAMICRFCHGSVTCITKCIVRKFKHA